MKILAFSASVRIGSLNTRLVTLIARKLADRGVEVDLADFHEFDMPLYDGNLEAADGVPEGARKLGGRILAADGVVIVSPEFNHGVAAPLKNALDWVSRIKPFPTANKPGFVASAAPSVVGGWRGAIALLPSLTYLGMWLSGDMFCLAQANKAFDEDGGLVDPTLDRMLDRMLGNFVKAVNTLDFS
jgi:NAD(P)H-dependent FMN reductase